MVLGILAVSIFNLDEYGVSIVGDIPTGLPTPGLPQVSLTDLAYLVTGALGIVFLAVGESLGGARSFAAKHRYEINPDQELIALGAANISAGLFQGFTVDASLSSSATADEAGARTQLSSIVTAVLIIVTLLVLAPLFHNLPNAVLGAIVIASVIGLMNVAELKRFYASNRVDFVLAMVAMFGVLTTDVLTGLLIAVFLSLLIILYRASRPYIAVLGKVPGQVATYGDISRHPENAQVPNLLIVRLDAPLYFLNANLARGQILDLVTSQPAAAHGHPLRPGRQRGSRCRQPGHAEKPGPRTGREGRRRAPGAGTGQGSRPVAEGWRHGGDRRKSHLPERSCRGSRF